MELPLRDGLLLERRLHEVYRKGSGGMHDSVAGFAGHGVEPPRSSSA
jgi:hypothetical protein